MAFLIAHRRNFCDECVARTLGVDPSGVLLADLGVTKTHSRPHVSNDNPFSEAQFKTLTYRPSFPERFGAILGVRGTPGPGLNTSRGNWARGSSTCGRVVARLAVGNVLMASTTSPTRGAASWRPPRPRVTGPRPHSACPFPPVRGSQIPQPRGMRAAAGGLGCMHGRRRTAP
jgi:hypothetical protein